MSITVTTSHKDAVLDSGFDGIYNSGILEIYSGTKPTNASATPTGTLLASITLPADAFAASSGGVKAKSGTWQDASANATGTAGWFRMKQAADSGTATETDERMDGTVTATGGGGDLILDNVSIASGQPVTINSFSVTI